MTFYSPQTHEEMVNITDYQENGIKTTMRKHLTHVRMTPINKSVNHQYISEQQVLVMMWRKGSPRALPVGL